MLIVYLIKCDVLDRFISDLKGGINMLYISFKVCLSDITWRARITVYWLIIYLVTSKDKLYREILTTGLLFFA